MRRERSAKQCAEKIGNARAVRRETVGNGALASKGAHKGLYPILRHIDRILARWAHRKFKFLARHFIGDNHSMPGAHRAPPAGAVRSLPSARTRPNNGSRMRGESHVQPSPAARSRCNTGDQMMSDWDTGEVMKAPPRECEECHGKGTIESHGEVGNGRNIKCVACDGIGHYCPHGVRNRRHCAICTPA
jgi:hypothetical protein